MTAPACCPNCGHRIASDAEAIEAKERELRDWCQRTGQRLTPDGRVQAHVAAEILGVAVGTLANWRCGLTGPKFSTQRGRVAYALRDLADYILNGGP